MTEQRLIMEELETGKEELLATNQALQEANAALQEKLAAIARAHSDLENLMAATEGGTLFLDCHLCVTRFTAGITHLFAISRADQGRPLTDLTHRLRRQQLAATAQQVLDSGIDQDDEVESLDGRWYLMRLRPYRTAAGQQDGVVITFIDITARRQAQKEVSQARVYAEKIVDTVREALVVLTPDLRIQSANRSFYRSFNTTPAATEGRLIYELGDGQWNIPQLRTLLEEVLPTNESFHDYEVKLDLAERGPRTMVLNARRLDHVQLILLAIEDVTAHAQAVSALGRTRDLLTLAMNASQLGWGTWNLQTGETEWDARGKAIIGFAEEAEARSTAGWLARIHPADRHAIEAYMHRLAEGERFRTEYRVVHPNGAVRSILGTGIFFQEESSGPIRGTGLVQDITEQRQAEAELRRLTETLETQVALRTEQVRALASTLTMAEHEERRHISQILHDDLQQLLYGIQMRMMMVIESIKSEAQENLLSTAQEVYHWLSDAIETTRELTVELSPPILEGEGLAEALGWLITQMAQVYRLRIDLQTAVDIPVTDKEMRVLLFQIVRELLFNVFKHAGTDQATVALVQGEGGGLRINVSDAGRGFDVTAAEARHDGGFGLFSVRERLGLFGGHMVIDSAPGAGTRITIYTPAIHKVHALDRKEIFES